MTAYLIFRLYRAALPVGGWSLPWVKRALALLILAKGAVLGVAWWPHLGYSSRRMQAKRNCVKALPWV